MDCFLVGDSSRPLPHGRVTIKGNGRSGYIVLDSHILGVGAAGRLQLLSLCMLVTHHQGGHWFSAQTQCVERF